MRRAGYNGGESREQAEAEEGVGGAGEGRRCGGTEAVADAGDQGKGREGGGGERRPEIDVRVEDGGGGQEGEREVDCCGVEGRAGGVSDVLGFEDLRGRRTRRPWLVEMGEEGGGRRMRVWWFRWLLYGGCSLQRRRCLGWQDQVQIRTNEVRERRYTLGWRFPVSAIPRHASDDRQYYANPLSFDRRQ